VPRENECCDAAGGSYATEYASDSKCCRHQQGTKGNAQKQNSRVRRHKLGLGVAMAINSKSFNLMVGV
jgi:hypothetical protein